MVFNLNAKRKKKEFTTESTSTSLIPETFLRSSAETSTETNSFSSTGETTIETPSNSTAVVSLPVISKSLF